MSCNQRSNQEEPKDVQEHNPVREAVHMIAESIKNVVEMSKNMEFKHKCLNILNADDYDELHHKARRKLLKLLKYRRHPGTKTRNKENGESESVQNDSFLSIASSPVHKRTRREPLTSSPKNQFHSGPIHCVLPKSIHTKGRHVTNDGEKRGKTEKGKEVDMSLLCDFVNGDNDDDDDVGKWFQVSGDVATGSDVTVNEKGSANDHSYEDTWIRLSGMDDFDTPRKCTPNNDSSELTSNQQLQEFSTKKRLGHDNTQRITSHVKDGSPSADLSNKAVENNGGYRDSNKLLDQSEYSISIITEDVPQSVPDGTHAIYGRASQQEHFYNEFWKQGSPCKGTIIKEKEFWKQGSPCEGTIIKEKEFWKQGSPCKGTIVKEKDPFDLCASDLFRICEEFS